MTNKSLPERWKKSRQAVKAVQVAFDTNEEVAKNIRVAAVKAGISASDQIRTIIGLNVSSKPKRPRLTVSLSEDDYKELAKRYAIKRVDKLKIKAKVMEELRNFTE